MRAAPIALAVLLVGCAAHRSTLASWRPLTGRARRLDSWREAASGHP